MKILKHRFLLIIMIIHLISLGITDISSIQVESMDGVEIAAFIAPGVDTDELNFIQSYLETYGCHFTIAGTASTVAGISVDILIDDINITSYDCILIPGGDSPMNLIQDAGVIELVKTAYIEGLLLAAICHGPLVLAEAEVINGTEVTGHQEIRSALEAAGGNYVFDDVVVDGYIITANWPYFEELSIAIATTLGYYERNPPTITNCTYEVVSNLNDFNITTYRLIAIAEDDSRTQMITAYFYEASENQERLYNYFIAFGELKDKNNNGTFSGTFSLDQGFYLIDLEAKDIYGNTFILSDANFLPRITEQIDDSGSENTSEELSGMNIPFILPLFLLFYIWKRK